MQNNRSKTELVGIAINFFYYIFEIQKNERNFTYFDSEEIKLYINLLEMAEKGLNESNRLVNYLLQKEKICDKDAAELLKSKVDELNGIYSEKGQQLPDQAVPVEAEGIKSPSKKNKSVIITPLGFSKLNNYNSNSNNNINILNLNDTNLTTANNENSDKNATNSQDSENKTHTLEEEELKEIKNRVHYFTFNKKTNFSPQKSLENIKIRSELIKKNNDFLISKCSDIVDMIKDYILASQNSSDNNNNNNYAYGYSAPSLSRKSHLNKTKSKSLYKQFVLNKKNTNKKLTQSSSIFTIAIDPDPILPRGKGQKDYFDIFDWDDIEICKQLTLFTHFLFQRIKFKEIINSQWTKIDKKTTATNVYSLIERFNKISLWACEEILSYDRSTMRKLVLDKFINIAHTLYKMNNFNDAFAIVTSLNSFFIKDLKKSWRIIDANISIPKAKELNEIFAYAKNYSKLREQLDLCLEKPCVPFLGLFLKDLSYMDESQKYIIEKPLNQPDASYNKYNYLLNLEKIRMVDKIFTKFEQFQNVKYNFKPVFKLSFLANPDPLNENFLIDLSRKLGKYNFITI